MKVPYVFDAPGRQHAGQFVDAEAVGDARKIEGNLGTLTFAATSEYLAWRDLVYIVAGFAGVVALCLALVQPLLAAGWLPGLRPLHGRRVHRVLGVLLFAAVIVHVAGLWITSPPDIEDAQLLRSPTPFSVWCVAAMWALFAAALAAALRRRLSPLAWRLVHTSLAGVVVLGGVIHAMLIEGTMETTSKTVLCGLAPCSDRGCGGSPVAGCAKALPWQEMRFWRSH